MKSLTELLSLAVDWELFRKPNSTAIRQSVVKDILSVDGSKWFHPKLPEGDPYWGTIRIIDGKEVYEKGHLNLFVCEHPDLDYRLEDYPLFTCKFGEFENMTRKDCDIIRYVLYTSKDCSVSYINPKLANKSWYVLWFKLTHYI